MVGHSCAWGPRSPGRLLLFALCAYPLDIRPREANALEIRGGVGVGALMLGVEPNLAVSPHVGVSWGGDVGVRLALHNQLSLMPTTTDLGMGYYNQTSCFIGFSTPSLDVAVGPSLSIYSTPVCNDTACGRVVGLGPGAGAEASIYMLGPLGIAVSVHIDWVGGASLLLPGGVAAMVAIGPVLRWRVT